MRNDGPSGSNIKPGEVFYQPTGNTEPAQTTQKEEPTYTKVNNALKKRATALGHQVVGSNTKLRRKGAMRQKGHGQKERGPG